VSEARRTTGKPRIKLDDVLEAPLTGYCHSCVSDWFAATGQGDLSEALARAREPDVP
jgi:hypothetical protein